MKNYKTTLAGLVGALPFAIDALVQAYTAGFFTDKTGWQLFGALAVILITSLTKDHNVTGGTVATAEEPIQGGGTKNDPPKP